MRAFILPLALLAGSSAFAQDADDLAKQLANPIASLTSVPFQYNYAAGAGPAGESTMSRLNVQPVIPMSIGDGWNLISRTIVPFVSQDDIAPGGWTFGALANHIVSFAGNDTRREVNTTFFQPFLSKRIGPGRTVSTNFESTYDWERGQWFAPLNVGISQVLPVGRQMVSLQVGGAWYVEAHEGAPSWSARLTVTLLYKRR